MDSDLIEEKELMMAPQNDNSDFGIEFNISAGSGNKNDYKIK